MRRTTHRISPPKKRERVGRLGGGLLPRLSLALASLWLLGLAVLILRSNDSEVDDRSPPDADRYPADRRMMPMMPMPMPRRGGPSDGGGGVGGGGAESRGRTPPLLRPAAADRVVESLLDLARTPASELRRALNASDSGGPDPLRLAELERGLCPWGDGYGGPTTVDFLPERPMPEPAEMFRLNGRGGRPTLLWYDHLSKAGGTSFCKLAQSNMPREEVPRYYCMPSSPTEVDAKVGSWTNDELVRYLSRRPHRVVSNEWDPFPPERFEFQARSRDDLRVGVNKGPRTPSSPLPRPLLIFVTSVRDPLDRLLSAYKFWGILHHPGDDKPALPRWLFNVQRRARNLRAGRAPDAFRSNVGNFNFATWKFSNGTLPFPPEAAGGGGVPSISGITGSSLDEEDWRPPFEAAVRTLSRFDLVLPMELLSDHTGAIREILGWTRFDKDHVVPSGRVLNNDAMSQLPRHEYDALWAANWLDMILYHWARAVFLVRIHCKDILEAS